MCFKFLHRCENLHTGFVLCRTDVQSTHSGDPVFVTAVITIIIIICATSIAAAAAAARCCSTQPVGTAAARCSMAPSTGHKQLSSSKRHRQHPSTGPASHARDN